jgi:outer membrane receptor protein involved in Fe transport
VFRGSGQPGSGASVQLRGPTSISESQDPLLVIDGIISSFGALNDVNASDIARVEVLKGAAAAAEYGSRGRAG